MQKALSYIRNLYAVEDDVLRGIRLAFEQRGLPIQVGAEEGRILQWLVRLHGAKTLVEIGTLGGYSAIWMARGLPEGGHLHTVEQDAEHAALARQFISQSDVAAKITVYEGKALEILPRLAQELVQVDAVFIDADKRAYPDYLAWAEAHLRQGGLVMADNTLLFGAVCDDALPDNPKAVYGAHVRATAWQAMKAFNARLADTTVFDGLMLPTEEGLSVAVKRWK